MRFSLRSEEGHYRLQEERNDYGDDDNHVGCADDDRHKYDDRGCDDGIHVGSPDADAGVTKTGTRARARVPRQRDENRSANFDAKWIQFHLRPRPHLQLHPLHYLLTLSLPNSFNLDVGQDHTSPRLTTIALVVSIILFDLLLGLQLQPCLKVNRPKEPLLIQLWP